MLGISEDYWSERMAFIIILTASCLKETNLIFLYQRCPPRFALSRTSADPISQQALRYLFPESHSPLHNFKSVTEVTPQINQLFNFLSFPFIFLYCFWWLWLSIRHFFRLGFIDVFRIILLQIGFILLSWNITIISFDWLLNWWCNEWFPKFLWILWIG